MGMKCEINDNLLQIQGGHLLHGAHVKASDLRAGIALTLAGLGAEGETLIEDCWQVERGYNGFVEKMKSLGGAIDYA